MNTKSSARQSRSVVADDRVLLATRLVAAFVVLILVLAVWVLYFLPDQTDQYFAWTIKPLMTPLAMGAGYAMGAFFFIRVLISKSWRSAALGFLPITVFTIFMLLATLLHWDRFHQGTWSFELWLGVYLITPFLVPYIWFRNRGTDPGTSEPGDPTVPLMVRRAAAIGGMGITVFGILIFLVPDLAIRIWPWQLTPLTARILAGWLMLPGIGGLVLSREPRWNRGWRLLVETLSVGALLFFIGVTRAWSDWNLANPLSALVLAALIFAVLILLVLYARTESLRRSMSKQAVA